MAYFIPQMPLAIRIWRWSSYVGVIPPPTLPDVTDIANLTPGVRLVDAITTEASYILILTTCDIRFSEDGSAEPFSGVNPDLVEVPAMSGRFYEVFDVEYLGMGFANQHQVATIGKKVPWPSMTPPPPGGDLLLEDGTDYLLEDNTPILLE